MYVQEYLRCICSCLNIHIQFLFYKMSLFAFLPRGNIMQLTTRYLLAVVMVKVAIHFTSVLQSAPSYLYSSLVPSWCSSLL